MELVTSYICFSFHELCSSSHFFYCPADLWQRKHFHLNWCWWMSILQSKRLRDVLLQKSNFAAFPLHVYWQVSFTYLLEISIWIGKCVAGLVDREQSQGRWPSSFSGVLSWSWRWLRPTTGLFGYPCGRIVCDKVWLFRSIFTRLPWG